MKLLMATNNSGKVTELLDLLDMPGVTAVTLGEAGYRIEVTEDGKTFAQNAFKKAMETHRITGMVTVADDSGLCVKALSGAPGIYSARWAGEGATGEDMVKKLLGEMRGIADREAEFVSSVVMVFSENDYIIAEGRCRGVIAEKPSGKGGFGYDPVFYVPEKGKTFAEMSAAEKNEISHRAEAIRDLKRKLAERKAPQAEDRLF